ncbi:MAG: hypothetical protein WB341_10785 [Terracidiphilus sp.]
MAFFGEYLKKYEIIRDPRFDESNEEALVHFLLRARLRNSAAGVEVRTGFLAQREVNLDLADPRAEGALMFVSAFVCYFVTKPVGYLREMETFKQHFIPGFAEDRAKQMRLARGLREEFFHATAESLETTETLDLLFDIAMLGEAVGDPIWTTDLPRRD